MCHCVGVGVQTKTTFWGSLPWALFGLAAEDEEIARGVARNCVAMFDAQDCTAMSYTSTASFLLQSLQSRNFIIDNPRTTDFYEAHDTLCLRFTLAT